MDSISYPVAVSQTLQDLSYDPVINLSPDLLKAQFVRGSKCARKTLYNLNFYSWFSIYFSINSKFPKVCFKIIWLLTLNKLFKLRLSWFRYQWFFKQDLIDKSINISPIEFILNFRILAQILNTKANYNLNSTYPGVKLSKSIDLVSISPLLLRYSKMIPGGWNLSKNLFNFILF